MMNAVSALGLYDWMEIVALLVAISGTLIVTASAAVRSMDRLLHEHMRWASLRPGDILLIAELGKHGKSHLAWGGLLFVIAETLELVVY